MLYMQSTVASRLQLLPSEPVTAPTLNGVHHENKCWDNSPEVKKLCAEHYIKQREDSMKLGNCHLSQEIKDCASSNLSKRILSQKQHA